MKPLGIFLSCALLIVLTWVFIPGFVKLKIEEISNVSAYLHNSNGRKAFNDKDLGLAMSEWTEALAVNPFEEKLHFNMGLALQTLKRGEEAEKSYNMVLKAPKKSLLETFLTEFNLGTLFQENKDVDKALLHYQAALEIDPTSRETKINIELLIQQNGGGGGGEGDKDKKPKEGEDKKKDGEGDEDKDKKYAPNQKPQKPQFKSEELTPSDVNKILGEIKQQEQRIRSEYSKKDPKEGKRDKDW